MENKISNFEDFYCNKCKIQVRGKLDITTFQPVTELDTDALDNYIFRYSIQNFQYQRFGEGLGQGYGQDIAVYMCPTCGQFKAVFMDTYINDGQYNFIKKERYPLEKQNEFVFLESNDKEDLEEIYKMFNQGIYAPMINSARTLLQKIIRKELEVAEYKTLYNEIEILYTKGIITKTLASVAHKIRCIGNDYVHPRGGNSKDELENDAVQILELIENIILMVIEIPEKLGAKKVK